MSLLLYLTSQAHWKPLLQIISEAVHAVEREKSGEWRTVLGELSVPCEPGPCSVTAPKGCPALSGTILAPADPQGCSPLSAVQNLSCIPLTVLTHQCRDIFLPKSPFNNTLIQLSPAEMAPVPPHMFTVDGEELAHKLISFPSCLLLAFVSNSASVSLSAAGPSLR